MILVLNAIRAFLELLVILVFFKISVFPLLILTTIRFDEINSWLHVLGFDHVRFTEQNRNLLSIARRIR